VLIDGTVNGGPFRARIERFAPPPADGSIRRTASLFLGVVVILGWYLLG
jgi:hypothetical protein